MLRNDSGRRGFSLGELVLIFVILAIMMIIMLPGLLRMRASARQQNCQYNLTVLHQALEAYHTTHMRYPIGTINPAGPIRSVAEGYHHNWIAGLLPSLNAMGIYQAIDRDVSVYDEANTMPRATRLARLLCPSASARFENTSCYAGSHHDAEEPIDSTNNGMMILNTALSRDDAVDGLDYTVIVGEKLTRHDPELGWISGTRSTLRNTGHRINQAMPYPPGEPVPAHLRRRFCERSSRRCILDDVWRSNRVGTR